ncbi:MAG: fused MFS/spermidine synthase [Planctomycetaceae bacterium]
MASTAADSPIFLNLSQRSLCTLTALFIGSGCAALIYEIVWFQLLQFVIGSSAVSLAALLGTFMGGMCLGSLLVPRWVSDRTHPLRAYAWLELGIGLCGLIVLFGMPLVGTLYSSYVGYGLPGIALRAVVAAVCLVPPTLLMGATLPVIARSVNATPQGVSWLGLFYAGNLTGAVSGCLLAGFYLLRVYDVAIATYVAAAMNLAVALIALLLAARTPYFAPAADARQETGSVASPCAGRVFMAIALSGLCALGAEVIWTRLLSLMLGGTVYTFSIILAVFLVGLGIGSGFGARLRHWGVSPATALGICQLLLVAAIGWAAWQLAGSLPYWPIQPGLARSPWLMFQLDLIRCLWAVLPAACLWGASFPLALKALASPGHEIGRVVGRVYAANTLGAIIGAVVFSTLLIDLVGTQKSQQLMMLLTTVSGLVVLLPAAWRQTSDSPAGVGPPAPRLARVFAVVGALGLALLLVRNVPPIPSALIACGRNLLTDADKGVVLFQGEGLTSSVAVNLLLDGNRSYSVSGKVEASSAPPDMRMEKMLGHIPALLHPRPRSVLVVGCGAGVTAGSFTTHPDVDRIVICEIEPLVPRFVATYFNDENYNVMRDPRVRVEYDDARHFILTTNERFDIITSDPIHPWIKGSATLYTTEYFELCKKRLNPGGFITQWVPLYETSADAIKSELATLFSVFPAASIWGNDTADGNTYDLVVLAQREPLRVDVDQTIARLQRDDHRRVATSLATVGFQSAVDLLARYGGQATDLAPWLKDAQLNRDRNLRLQYLAGLGQNTHRHETIYNDILAYRRFSDAIFVASDLRRKELKLRLDGVRKTH